VLDPVWLERMGGLEIAELRQLVVTQLEGRLVDQSALQGALDTLFMLGLRLMFVERLPLASPGRPDAMAHAELDPTQQAG
jgi:hypothetical protein